MFIYLLICLFTYLLTYLSIYLHIYIYIHIISRAINEIHREIEPMMPRIQYDAAESEALPPTLARDVACLQADTSKVLVEAAGACVSATQRICRKHGLLLNFSKGKSEVLLKLHGPQSAAIRRRLHFDEAGQLAFEPGNRWSMEQEQ